VGSLAAQSTVILVETVSEAVQGGEYDLLLTVDSASAEIAVFDLTVAFNSELLELVLVEPGERADSLCHWTKFDYKFNSEDTRVGEYPNGRLRITGAVDSGCGFAAGEFLASLKFRVSNEHKLECEFLPVSFFWTNELDNRMVRIGNEGELRCHFVLDHTGEEIAGDASYPSMSPGMQDVEGAVFHNGGIGVVCPDEAEQ